LGAGGEVAAMRALKRGSAFVVGAGSAVEHGARRRVRAGLEGWVPVLSSSTIGKGAFCGLDGVVAGKGRRRLAGP